jgi:hypothetical protein
LGNALDLSASQVHRSVQRATEAGLAVSKGWGDWQVVPEALLEYPNREYLLVVASAPWRPVQRSGVCRRKRSRDY